MDDVQVPFEKSSKMIVILINKKIHFFQFFIYLKNHIKNV